MAHISRQKLYNVDHIMFSCMSNYYFTIVVHLDSCLDHGIKSFKKYRAG